MKGDGTRGVCPAFGSDLGPDFMKNLKVVALTSKSIQRLVCVTVVSLLSLSPALAKPNLSTSTKVNTGLSGGEIVPRLEEYQNPPAPYKINPGLDGGIGGGGGCGPHGPCPSPYMNF